jgi:hypothetical protein
MTFIKENKCNIAKKKLYLIVNKYTLYVLNRYLYHIVAKSSVE